jgi:hypothetical protein
MILSPLNKTMAFQTNRLSHNFNKTHQAGGFSFVTSIQGHDEPVDLLDLENRKAAKNSVKAVTGVKLKILDDFNRREMGRDLTEKAEKASRVARQLMTLSIKTRSEANAKGRDEKIRMIKISHQREAQIE